MVKNRKKHKKPCDYCGEYSVGSYNDIRCFFWYVSDYRADEKALEVLTQDIGITEQDQLTILSPPEPSDMAIIFYPGVKVGSLSAIADQIR